MLNEAMEEEGHMFRGSEGRGKNQAVDLEKIRRNCCEVHK